MSRLPLSDGVNAGDDTDEGIWIRTGDEFGLRTQTFVIAAIASGETIS
jgi:hypothetical protein